MDPTSYAADDSQVVREDETFTRRVLERLKMIMGTVSEAANDLGMLNDRQFGPTPSGTAGGKGEAPSPGGRVGEIMLALDRLQQHAAIVASQARALNTRI